MSSDDWFTLIWGSCSILIGIIGGYFIYRRAKRIEHIRKSVKKEKI